MPEHLVQEKRVWEAGTVLCWGRYIVEIRAHVKDWPIDVAGFLLGRQKNQNCT